MKVETNITVVGNRYRVQILAHAFSAAEEEQMTREGAPVVEAGGSFSGTATRPGAGSPTSVTFSFPPLPFVIDSKVPLVREFDLTDDSDSDVQAKVYADTLLQRITDAKAVLMAGLPTLAPFEGDSLVTV